MITVRVRVKVRVKVRSRVRVKVRFSSGEILFLKPPLHHLLSLLLLAFLLLGPSLFLLLLAFLLSFQSQFYTRFLSLSLR